MDLSFRDVEITDYASMSNAMRALLLAHPLLAPLEEYLSGGEEFDLGLQDAVEDIQDQVRFSTDHGYADAVLFRDCLDDIENFLDRVLDHRNNAWNFAPGVAPQKLNWRLCFLVARALLTTGGLVNVTVSNIMPNTVVVIRQVRSTWWVEAWQWPADAMNAGYREQVCNVSKHRSPRKALKSAQRAAELGEGIEFSERNFFM